MKPFDLDMMRSERRANKIKENKFFGFCLYFFFFFRTKPAQYNGIEHHVHGKMDIIMDINMCLCLMSKVPHSNVKDDMDKQNRNKQKDGRRVQ